MTFEEIEKGIEQIWMAKLVREWYMQMYDLCNRMGKNYCNAKILEVPNFRIGKASRRWGTMGQKPEND